MVNKKTKEFIIRKDAKYIPKRLRTYLYRNLLYTYSTDCSVREDIVVKYKGKRLKFEIFMIPSAGMCPNTLELKMALSHYFQVPEIIPEVYKRKGKPSISKWWFNNNTERVACLESILKEMENDDYTLTYRNKEEVISGLVKELLGGLVILKRINGRYLSFSIQGVSDNSTLQQKKTYADNYVRKIIEKLLKDGKT